MSRPKGLKASGLSFACISWTYRHRRASAAASATDARRMEIVIAAALLGILQQRARLRDGEADEDAGISERVLPTTARETGSRP